MFSHSFANYRLFTRRLFSPLPLLRFAHACAFACAWACLWGGFASVASAQPLVSGVVAVQRPGTQLVDITYNLAIVEGGTA